MEKYLSQLLEDIQTVITNRWRIHPPHFFKIGIPERWLTPPDGYKGPPFGFGRDEDSNRKKGYMAQLNLEKSQAEVENYLAGNAPTNMYGYFGFDPEQFPPKNKLQEEQLGSLCNAICRLWSAHNYTPIFPEETPPRILYSILLQAMHETQTLVNQGNIGIEFCDYNPEECPFGKAVCSCNNF